MNDLHLTKLFFWLILGLVLLFLLNISLGSVAIPPKATIQSLLNIEPEKASWLYIVREYRLPKALTAIMAGGALSVCGLMMQTLFRNPLAGPFVLGISSGAGLGVALLIMGAAVFGSASLAFSPWGVAIASGAGSFLVMLGVLWVSLRIKETMAVLIIGLMFASFTGAVVGVLSYFAPAEQLQQYVFWSLGSLGNNSWGELAVLGVCFITGMAACIFTIKPLNTLLLGERYAPSQGVNLARGRIWIILVTSILAGGVTAFAGPIAFIGLAVPHLVRQFIPSSNHLTLLPAVLLFGAVLMLLCDIVAQMPFSDYVLPINAITSLVGAPVVVWLLVKKRRLLF